MNRFALVFFCVLAACLPAIAQVGLPWPGPGGPASGGAGTTAWNPSDKVTFTVGTTTVTNDTVTAVSNGNYQDIRSCYQSSSCSSTPSNAYTSSYGGNGKVFAQFQITGSLFQSMVVGFCTNAISPFVGGSSAPCANNDNHGVIVDAGGFGNGSPALVFNSRGTTLSLGGSTSTSFAIELAFDIGGASSSCSGTPCAWARYWNGSAWTNWNNNGSASPGGSNPFILTGGPTGSFWAYAGESFNEASATAQILCSGFLHSSSVPSGFTAC